VSLDDRGAQARRRLWFRTAARRKLGARHLLDNEVDGLGRCLEHDATSVMPDQAHVADAVEPVEPPQRCIRRLDLRRMQRPAPVVVERDPPLEERDRDAFRVTGSHASELNPVRQREHVRGEAVAAVVRRAPELLGRHMRPHGVAGGDAVGCTRARAARP
jgi:hypothetical protein